MKVSSKTIIILFVLTFTFLLAIYINFYRTAALGYDDGVKQSNDDFIGVIKRLKPSSLAGSISNKKIIHIEELNTLYILLYDYDSGTNSLFSMNYNWAAIRQDFGDEQYYNYNDMCYDGNNKLYLITYNQIHVYLVNEGIFETIYDYQVFSQLGNFDLTNCLFSENKLYLGTRSAYVLILSLSSLTMETLHLESESSLEFEFTAAIAESNDDIILGTDDGLVFIDKTSNNMQFLHRITFIFEEEVTALAVSGESLYVGTWGGIFKLDLEDMSQQEEIDPGNQIKFIFVANDGLFYADRNNLHFYDGSSSTLENLYEGRSMVWIENEQIFLVTNEYDEYWLFQSVNIAGSINFSWVEVRRVIFTTTTTTTLNINYYNSGIWPLVVFLIGLASLSYVCYRLLKH
ncbi:MAG: hypothetical protein ACXAEU_11975 [Candidatus Hodarchaeales archaeon]|jgi:hypothetical protein